MLRCKDYNDWFTADTCSTLFPLTYCLKDKKRDRIKPGLFKEEFRCTEVLCLWRKTFCCYESLSNKFLFSSKRWNKRTFWGSGDGPKSKYRRVFGETEKVTSTSRWFHTKNNCVEFQRGKWRDSLLFNLNKKLSQMKTRIFHCKFRLHISEVIV